MTPVHDIVSEQNDLVIATHGRGFYVLDNIGMLRQMNSEVTQSAVYLFAPSNAIRSVSRGVTFDYFLKDAPQDFKMEISDSTGHIVQTLTSGAVQNRRSHSGGDDEEGGAPPPQSKAPAQKGMNRFTWDMRSIPPHVFPT